MAFHIEKADPRTPEALLLIKALSEELARRYDNVDDGSGNFKPEDVVGPGSGFLIGRSGNRPVACGAFRPLKDNIAEIKRMFVLADHRGHGYSRLILAELERLARECGYERVRLETGNRQPEAIALYERSGYHRMPHFGIYVGSDRSLCFEKWLYAADKEQAVSIRRAVETDCVGILECLQVAFAPYRVEYTPEAFLDTVLTPESLTRRIKEMTVMVAIANEQIVGTIAWSSHGSEGHLRGMAVRPELQGSGVSNQLLHAALDELRQAGCRIVTLDTTQPLRRAIRFYEKNGFSPSGKVEDFFGMPLYEYHCKL